jgi:hypothetical protein
MKANIKNKLENNEKKLKESMQKLEQMKKFKMPTGKKKLGGTE